MHTELLLCSILAALPINTSSREWQEMPGDTGCYSFVTLLLLLTLLLHQLPTPSSWYGKLPWVLLVNCHLTLFGSHLTFHPLNRVHGWRVAQLVLM